MGIKKKSAGKSKSETKKAAVSKSGAHKLRGVSNKLTERRKYTRKPYISPLGLDVQLLEQSFKILEPNGTKMAKRFYQILFKRYPGLKSLFSSTTQAKREKKLLTSLNIIIKKLRDPDTLVNVLTVLGKKQALYGALPEHYAAAASTLLDVLKEFTGDMWTTKMHDAWSGALETIAAIMLKDHDRIERDQPAKNTTVVCKPVNNDEWLRMRSAIDGSTTAIMIVDKDLLVTYVNDAAIILLSKNADALSQKLLGFNPEAIIGMCIDQLYNKSKHQQALLADVSSLPVTTEIKLGSLVFQINVTAISDNDGSYRGNLLEWHDITEQKLVERQMLKLIKATAQGDLSKRMSTEELTGCLKSIGSQINQLLDTIVEPILKSKHTTTALSNKDLPQNAGDEYN